MKKKNIFFVTEVCIHLLLSPLKICRQVIHTYTHTDSTASLLAEKEKCFYSLLFERFSLLLSLPLFNFLLPPQSEFFCCCCSQLSQINALHVIQRKILNDTALAAHNVVMVATHLTQFFNGLRGPWISS